MEKKFYEKTWFIILMLIFIFPLGLFLMWKYASWNKVAKIILTVILSILFIIGISGSAGNENTKNIDKSKTKQEQQIDQNTQQETKTEEKESEVKKEESNKETQITLSDDEIVTFLNGIEDFDGIWKKYQDSFIVFYPSGDLATAFETLYMYPDNEDSKSAYQQMLDSFCTLSSTVDKTAGKPCMIGIANPTNTDNVLVTFMDGKVVYNAFDEL